MARALVATVTLLAVFFSIGEGKVTMRHKRSLSFNNVAICYTGKSGSFFTDYGCYCNKAGQGNPVDALDSCCEKQSTCYKAVPFGCNPSFMGYAAKCVDGQVQCDNLRKCEKAICNCDIAAASCLAAAPYDANFKNYRGPC